MIIFRNTNTAIIEIHGLTLENTSKHAETNPVALTLWRRMRFVFLLPLVSSKDLEQMLGDTPPVWKGSSNLFRNLREGGRVLLLTSCNSPVHTHHVWQGGADIGVHTIGKHAACLNGFAIKNNKNKNNNKNKLSFVMYSPQGFVYRGRQL